MAIVLCFLSKIYTTDYAAMLACFMGLSLDGIVDDMQKDLGIPQISFRLYSFFQGFFTNFLAKGSFRNLHYPVSWPSRWNWPSSSLARRSPGPKQQLSFLSNVFSLLSYSYLRTSCTEEVGVR